MRSNEFGRFRVPVRRNCRQEEMDESRWPRKHKAGFGRGGLNEVWSLALEKSEIRNKKFEVFEGSRVQVSEIQKFDSTGKS
jgi:hypothetical protein